MKKNKENIEEKMARQRQGSQVKRTEREGERDDILI